MGISEFIPFHCFLFITVIMYRFPITSLLPVAYVNRLLSKTKYAPIINTAPNAIANA